PGARYEVEPSFRGSVSVKSMMGIRAIALFLSISRNDLFHDPSVHVGKAKVSACVSIREFFVIEPKKMEDRGVEVVNVHLVIYSSDAELVRGAMDISTARTAAG